MTVNFDHHRANRTGIAEVILAEPKTPEDLESAINQSLQLNNSVLITRILRLHIDVVAKAATFNDVNIIWDPYQRTAILGEVPECEDTTRIAVISAGTSDQPIVEEILLSLTYFGLSAKSFSDVGVAGLHRHQEVLEELSVDGNIRILIVVAGNEGALFPVVSGQTKLPVIAVPTSIGYGFGGKGETALRSALQACSPGVVTVNIDNGFGAAAFSKKFLQNL